MDWFSRLQHCFIAPCDYQTAQPAGAAKCPCSSATPDFLRSLVCTRVPSNSSALLPRRSTGPAWAEALLKTRDPSEQHAASGQRAQPHRALYPARRSTNHAAEAVSFLPGKSLSRPANRSYDLRIPGPHARQSLWMAGDSKDLDPT